MIERLSQPSKFVVTVFRDSGVQCTPVLYARCALCLIFFALAGPAFADSALALGGHVEFDYESEFNFDLANEASEDITFLTPSVQLETRYTASVWTELYLQLEFKREFALIEEGDDKNREPELEVEEAYLDVSSADHSLAMRAGRQEFKDHREWLYDEDLDGLRFFYEQNDFGLQAAWMRKRLVSKDLLNRDKRSLVNNYHLHLSHALGDDSEAAVYYLVQDDLSRDNESPVFLGIRSYGRIQDRIKYWFDLGYVRGRDGSDRIRAHALDLGGTLFLDWRLKPHVTFGYAHGSGDADTKDDVDRNFRQTGFEDNQAKFGGVTKFKYYGELFDPELKNLHIITVGVGVRPTKRSSIDIVVHQYRQDQLSDKLKGSNIDADPLGLSRDLGYEIDLILGHREFKDLRLELMVSYFSPGHAFDPSHDPAWFTGFEARYGF